MTVRYQSGRGRLIGGGIPVAAATIQSAYPPPSWAGWIAYCDDGRIRWSDGLEWLSAVDDARAAEIAEDVASNVIRPIRADIYIEIDATAPTVAGTRYQSIGEAAEYLSQFIGSYDRQWATRTAPNVAVMLKSGHIMREQIQTNAQLGIAELYSEDPVVQVDCSYLTRSASQQSSTHALFSAVGDGTMMGIRGVIFEPFNTPPMDPAREAWLGGPYTPLRAGLRGNSVSMAPAFAGTFGLTENRRAGFRNGWGIGITTVSGFSFISQAVLDNNGTGLFAQGPTQLVGCLVRGCTTVSVRSIGTGIVFVTQQIVGTGTADFPADHAQDYRRTAGVDGPSDFVVSDGGTIIIAAAAGIRGGISQPHLARTGAGLIADGRNAAPPTLTGIIRPAAYTVGTVPSAAANSGAQIYVTDGAAGAPVMAFSNGTDWLRCDTRTAISTS